MVSNKILTLGLGNELFSGDLTDECLENGNGTEPKSIVRSNSKSIGGGGSTRDPSRKGERPEKPVKDQDKVKSLQSGYY